MISTIVSLLLLFVAYGFFSHGEPTSGWICIGLIVLVWMLFASTMKDVKAWKNRRDYWARGGPAVEREVTYVRRQAVRERADVKRKWLNDAKDEQIVAGTGIKRSNSNNSGKTGVMGGYYRD